MPCSPAMRRCSEGGEYEDGELEEGEEGSHLEDQLLDALLPSEKEGDDAVGSLGWALGGQERF